MELADRANVLAKASSLEDAINRERGGEIADNNPGGRARPVPKGKGLIGPKVGAKEAGRDPLRTQRFWPVIAGRQELSSEVARKCEWTRHAKQIADHQQRNHSQPSPVSPRQDTSQVQRSDLRSKEPIYSDCG